MPLHVVRVVHSMIVDVCFESDVNYLSSNAPPAATEWQSLLRPLRGREPEGIWNLLLIVREMFRRSDSNAIPLLEILTDEILECDSVGHASQILILIRLGVHTVMEKRWSWKRHGKEVVMEESWK